MQDNASSHAGRRTQEVLRQLGIHPIFWPAFSPDLNPIESLWDLIKDWITGKYIMEDLKNYKTLRKALSEAWQSIGQAQLDHLIESMPARCAAVIAAKGEHTKY